MKSQKFNQNPRILGIFEVGLHTDSCGRTQ